MSRKGIISHKIGILHLSTTLLFSLGAQETKRSTAVVANWMYGYFQTWSSETIDWKHYSIWSGDLDGSHRYWRSQLERGIPIESISYGHSNQMIVVDHQFILNTNEIAACISQMMEFTILSQVLISTNGQESHNGWLLGICLAKNNLATWRWWWRLAIIRTLTWSGLRLASMWGAGTSWYLSCWW